MQTQSEPFIPLADTDAFDAFYAANRPALDAIADRDTVFALACNCELVVGGTRVGFVDGE
jgi:hypothetical protein